MTANGDAEELEEAVDTPSGIMDIVERRLTDQILSAYHAAWRATGFGMPEQICANTLAVELQARQLHYQRELWVEVVHRGVPVGRFRLDFVVESRIILETKSCETIRAADEVQLLNYLRCSEYELGFLLVFGVKPRFRTLAYSNSNKHR